MPTRPHKIGQHVAVPKPPYIYDSKGDVRQGAVNWAGDKRILRFPKTELSFVRINHQTRLQFEGTEVVIESPFALESASTRLELDPDDRAVLGPVLALYPDSLLAATLDPGGTLALPFASGAFITVRQDPRYEAWQVNGPGNYVVVCTPGHDGGTGDLGLNELGVPKRAFQCWPFAGAAKQLLAMLRAARCYSYSSPYSSKSKPSPASAA